MGACIAFVPTLATVLLAAIVGVIIGRGWQEWVDQADAMFEVRESEPSEHGRPHLTLIRFVEPTPLFDWSNDSELAR